jgi:hypothetical protein
MTKKPVNKQPTLQQIPEIEFGGNSESGKKKKGFQALLHAGGQDNSKDRF